MSNKPTILVTGAGGFVGGRVVEACYLGQLANVRAGVRKPASAARVARFPVEIVPCDIMDPAQVRAAMQGVTAVVHCAYKDNRQVIVEGTRNLLVAAREEGVQRFVFLSTAEVYGREVSGDIDETFVCQKTNRVYADSKIEAEQLCLEFHSEGLPVTILRPSIIYGPFGESWTIDQAKRLRSGNWGVFEGLGEGICNAVYVDDLVAAILKVIREDAAVGEIFNIVGPETITWNEYFQVFNRVLGLPELHRVSSSGSLVKSALRDRVSKFTGFFVDRFEDALMAIYLRGGVIGRTMKWVKHSLQTTPSTSELKGLYSRQARFVSRKAESRLNFHPRVDLQSGLEMSAAWLAHHGYVPVSADDRKIANITASH